MSGEKRRVMPLAGPLDVEPTRAVYALLDLRDVARPDIGRYPALDLARAMLDEALADVQLGAYDARIVEWVKGWDVPTVATLASILRRAFVAGAEAGRREVVDETPAVQALRAELDEALRLQDLDTTTADQADRDLEALRAERADLRAELVAVRGVVADFAAAAEVGNQPTGRELLASVDAITGDEGIVADPTLTAVVDELHAVTERMEACERALAAIGAAAGEVDAALDGHTVTPAAAVGGLIGHIRDVVAGVTP